jgi:hypothetical protein
VVVVVLFVVRWDKEGVEGRGGGVHVGLTTSGIIKGKGKKKNKKEGKETERGLSD